MTSWEDLGWTLEVLIIFELIRRLQWCSTIAGCSKYWNIHEIGKRLCGRSGRVYFSQIYPLAWAKANQSPSYQSILNSRTPKTKYCITWTIRKPANCLPPSLLRIIRLVNPLAGDQRLRCLRELEVRAIDGGKSRNFLNVKDVQTLVLRTEELGIRECR